ncbi:hypothetical protein QZH41_001872 [Actinostola sp. cb2023]|nr:hypothetical protein QZH41_001872 [Actinostola sp. cb2023]
MKKVQGRLEPVVNGLSVRQFLGVPYAEPPVGQLRFAHPKPAKKWDGIRDAVEFGPECPQASMEDMAKEMNITGDGDEVRKVPQSEDCLSLNVYTPSHATAQDKLAVMVWIHGGGFIFGSARSYNPSVLVALHDVIVVSINYRLGVLGFFNIPGTDVKGNYAMFDQIDALGDGMKMFLPNKFSDLEVGLSKYVMRLLTQFAKYGVIKLDSGYEILGHLRREG